MMLAGRRRQRGSTHNRYHLHVTTLEAALERVDVAGLDCIIFVGRGTVVRPAHIVLDPLLVIHGERDDDVDETVRGQPREGRGGETRATRWNVVANDGRTSDQRATRRTPKYLFV